MIPIQSELWDNPLGENNGMNNLELTPKKEHQKINDEKITKNSLKNNETGRLLETYLTSEESGPLLNKEIRSILSQHDPKCFELCQIGIGGTYFIKDPKNGKRLAVFKPQDEEPGSEVNPKGLIEDPILPPGGGAIREFAAYLLDKENFAGVPETFIIRDLKHASFKNSKSGSVQRYIVNSQNFDLSSSYFSIQDVHKIGIFDIRLLNIDRSGENMLIVHQNSENNSKNGQKSVKLVPIDHSYILPPNLSKFVYFEWLHWKQAKQPFSAEHLDYIRRLNVSEDAEILRRLGLESSIKTMMICTMLLKLAAVKWGYNLFQIGQILSRKKISGESELEQMVKEAELWTLENNLNFMENLEAVMEEKLKNSSRP